MCFPFSFIILGNYDSSVRTPEICNKNIPPLFLRNMLSSVPQPQDLSCGLMHGTPLHSPLIRTRGVSGQSHSSAQHRAWRSAPSDEAKISHSQQRSLCLASFSLLPLSLSVGLLLCAPQQSRGCHSHQLWTTLSCQEYSLLSNCMTRQPLPASPVPI